MWGTVPVQHLCSTVYSSIQFSAVRSGASCDKKDTKPALFELVVEREGVVFLFFFLCVCVCDNKEFSYV